MVYSTDILEDGILAMKLCFKADSRRFAIFHMDPQTQYLYMNCVDRQIRNTARSGSSTSRLAIHVISTRTH